MQKIYRLSRHFLNEISSELHKNTKLNINKFSKYINKCISFCLWTELTNKSKLLRQGIYTRNYNYLLKVSVWTMDFICITNHRVITWLTNISYHMLVYQNTRFFMFILSLFLNLVTEEVLACSIIFWSYYILQCSWAFFTLLLRLNSLYKRVLMQWGNSQNSRYIWT